MWPLTCMRPSLCSHLQLHTAPFGHAPASTGLQPCMILLLEHGLYYTGNGHTSFKAHAQQLQASAEAAPAMLQVSDGGHLIWPGLHKPHPQITHAFGGCMPRLIASFMQQAALRKHVLSDMDPCARHSCHFWWLHTVVKGVERLCRSL